MVCYRTWIVKSLYLHSLCGVMWYRTGRVKEQDNELFAGQTAKVKTKESSDVRPIVTASLAWARMHHKVVGNFGSEADVRSLYFRGFRFNETSDNGACTQGQPAQ